MKVTLRTKGLLLVIIGAGLWGISGTVAQFLFQQKGFSPEWLVVIRLLVSGILLISYGVIKRKGDIFKIWTIKRDVVQIIIFSIFGMLSVQYTYFASINYGNAATATILQYLNPVIILIYLTMVSKKVPRAGEVLTIILAVLGTFLIITNGSFSSISISLLAIFWGIASAFAAAFYTLYPRKLLLKYDSITVVGWGMLIGGVLFSFVHRPWDFQGVWSPSSIIALGFVVIFGTLVGFCCYLQSLKYIRATEASILSSVEPLSAAVLSVVWLNVPIGIFQGIGTALIIGIILLLSLAKGEKTS